MIVVSNAGPIIALTQIRQLELVRGLFGQIRVPEAVRAELIQCRLEIEAATWIISTPVEDVAMVRLLRERLDAGESEAIVTALHLGADLLLMDEARGRRVADAQGLKYTGTIGVLVLAKKRGLISAVTPLLDQLRSVGLFMSDALYMAARQIAGEA